MAEKALAYDRSLYNEKINGWIDVRRAKDEDPIDFKSWCHGSVGIALSRLILSHYYSDHIIENEIDIAINNILKKGHSNKIFLCHGVLSDIEVLYACGLYRNKLHIQNEAIDWLNILNDKFYNDDSCFTFFDNRRMDVYGLFTGLTGLGYTFLRFYDWKNVPSILSLEPSHLPYKLLH